ncbi:MAG: phosphotransferase [Asgard group archaeon]|nr:phosphotransferase [Asgard group archaeon]
MSDMSQEHEHILEVQQELIKLGEISKESTFVKSNQIMTGGSVCILFELCFENPTRRFIQKIFRFKTSYEGAKLEYTNLKTLFENNLSVPQPYFLKPIPNTRNLPYYVMEKIEGLRLVDVKVRNPDKYEQFIEQLLKEMYKIHNLDSQSFPTIPIDNIEENPFAPIDKKLEICKIYLERYPEELTEFKPVVNWLEKNKTLYPCDKLVVTHGDYHSFNILVQENLELVILDWNAMSITDFRMDVAYTANSESYFDEKQTFKDRMKRASLIANIYEKISGRSIEGLHYFMILVSTFNLIRLYSQINNPDMTGENKDAIDFFFTVKDYFLFLANLIRETCNVELEQVEEYFK